MRRSGTCCRKEKMGGGVWVGGGGGVVLSLGCAKKKKKRRTSAAGGILRNESVGKTIVLDEAYTPSCSVGGGVRVPGGGGGGGGGIHDSPGLGISPNKCWEALVSRRTNGRGTTVVLSTSNGGGAL